MGALPYCLMSVDWQEGQIGDWAKLTVTRPNCLQKKGK